LVIALLAMAPAAVGQVSYDRIKNAASEPASWLTYSGSYASHRFSPLDEIDASNVSRLRPVWLYQTTSGGELETSPLVVDGILYLTEPRHRDRARREDRPARVELVPSHAEGIADARFRTNRGLASATTFTDARQPCRRLCGLEAVRWDVQIAENSLGYCITAALAIEGKIIVR
jgi:glucose dehydrogenase